MSDIKSQIQDIFNSNVITDLKFFLQQRHNLNSSNVKISYLFYFVQACAGFISAYGNGTKQPNIVWLGIALVALASFIYNCEKINDSLIRKYFDDINLIKSNNYTDESNIQLITQQTNLNKDSNV